MRSKLTINVDEYTDMRFGLIGLLFAFIGAGLGFTSLPVAGYGIELTGALVVLVGIGMHWYVNWRSILHADHVFRDSAFANDVAKTNMASILEQNGIQNVRSL